MLLGGASYEIDNEGISKRLVETQGAHPRIHPLRKIPMLTECIDGYATEETEEIAAIAHKDSRVAKLCDTYFHQLGEKTLLLLNGWQDRVEDVKFDGLEKLRIFRLNSLDFVFCKAAAGRDKDRVFLDAFVEEKNITEADIRKHWLISDGDNHPRIRESELVLANIRRSLGFSPSA